MVPDSWSVGIEIPGLAASVGNFDSILLRRGMRGRRQSRRTRRAGLGGFEILAVLRQENFAISFASAVSDELPGNRMMVRDSLDQPIARLRTTVATAC